MTTQYRCPSCHSILESHEVKVEDYLAIGWCCDEVCDRYFACTECGQREQHRGCEECFPCLLDAAIADPRTIEQCTADLQGEIARGLAERLRPWLSRRQAA